MDNKEKISKFLEEYQALTKKYGVDFISYPAFVPDKDGKFNVMIQTTPVEVGDNETNAFIVK